MTDASLVQEGSAVGEAAPWGAVGGKAS
jgi:hypothetical protein